MSKQSFMLTFTFDDEAKTISESFGFTPRAMSKIGAAIHERAIRAADVTGESPVGKVMVDMIAEGKVPGAFVAALAVRRLMDDILECEAELSKEGDAPWELDTAALDWREVKGRLPL